MALITGSATAESLFGTTLQDLILGLEGNDSITGGDGDDEIRGGEGNDRISGDDGNDKLFGGFDADTLDGGLGDDTLEGSEGNDWLSGGEGSDSLSGGSDNDVLNGGAGNDVINGDAGDDLIQWSLGSDVITGGSGFDTLDYTLAVQGVSVNLSTHAFVTGGVTSLADGIEKVIGTKFADNFLGDSGDNVFSGGAGNDTFRSKGGSDILTGGGGKDTYVYLKKDAVVGGVQQGVDYITDFGSNDQIDISDFFKSDPNADLNVAIQLNFDGVNTTLAVDVGGTFVNVVAFSGEWTATPSQLAEEFILAV